MTIENPPKLWAYLAPAIERGGAHDADNLRVFASSNERYANEGRAIAVSYYLDGRVSPVQAYVREDIASADVAFLAASWGALQAKHETETTALRRERDALAARVEKLRERLGRVVAMGPDEAPDSLADDAPDCDSFGSNEDAFTTGRSQGGQEAAWSSAREAAVVPCRVGPGDGVGTMCKALRLTCQVRQFYVPRSRAESGAK